MKRELIDNIHKIFHLICDLEDFISEVEYDDLNELLHREFLIVITYNPLLNYSQLDILLITHKVNELTTILQLMKDEVI